jgi:hypothetical protein
MSIKIVRNEAGNCVTFQGSSNPVYWNSCLSGEVDSVDSNAVNIKNDVRTITEERTVYEFFRIPYTEFLDADGNAFANPQAAADYITQEANVLGSIGEQVAASTDSFDFYIDARDNTVIMNTGDYFPVNTIQAVLDDETMSISSVTGSKVYYSGINLGNVSVDSTPLSGSDNDKINTLNALFQNSGTASGDIPSITSSLSVSLTEGDTLNYELTADNGVGYEWDLSNVNGITTVEGNVRKLIGGSSLAVGTYNIPVKAINYNGEDSQAIALTVSAPPFSNTKSVQLNSSDYLGANASLLDSTLGRSGNGSGSSDAWTVSFWIKPTHTASGRVVFYYGSNDTTNGGIIEIRMTSTHKLRLQYGSANNNIKIISPNALTNNVWQHIVYTYDGGATGASSGSIGSYYNKFELFIDGVSQTTSNSHNNYGWSGALSGQNLRVGKLVSGNTLTGEKIDELAIWDSDQTANISSIYNSGSSFDLSTLTTEPKHWWRMGDGDTYPYLQDSGTEGNCIFQMYNMTASDIVTDAP